MAFEFVVLAFIYAVILAVFFFIIPWIAVYKEKFRKVLKRALRIFAGDPFTCFFLSLAILVVLTSISISASRSAEIVQQFKPEPVYWLLLVGLAADVRFLLLLDRHGGPFAGR
jgi:hypothetical protein